MKRFLGFVAALALVFMLTGGTALAGPPAKFYDVNQNSFNDCDGVTTTNGGSFGTARWRLGAPNTVSVRARGLTPNTTYDVLFAHDCSGFDIGDLTTDARGNGSATASWSGTVSSANFQLFHSGLDRYATPQITF